MKNLLIAIGFAGVAASAAMAENASDKIKAQFKAQGYSDISVTEGAGEVLLNGKKGNEVAFVVLDGPDGDIIAQGKYRQGVRIGLDVIPDKDHKDDGVKYGDRTHDRTDAQGEGERHHNDDGEAGGAHEHDKSQSGKD